MNPTSSVRESCQRVMRDAKHVVIVESSIDKLAEKMVNNPSKAITLKGVAWDACNWHYCKDAKQAGPLTCQYIFVLDALNFCFWPTTNLEYDNIAVALKNVLEADSNAFDCVHLAALIPAELASWFPSHTLPELEERTLRLNELGLALQNNFQGLAANMVTAAKGSAVSLVSLVLQYLPGFRDTCIYRGRLVHFYKRAQILVGDVWAAYGKCGSEFDSNPHHPFYFRDIDQLTMFADYRVPQLLRHFGVLGYDLPLAAAVDHLQEVPFGSPQEVEIRAATVVAVEMLRKQLLAKGLDLFVVEVDWLLWQMGEESKDQIKPHHRTMTIYY